MIHHPRNRSTENGVRIVPPDAWFTKATEKTQKALEEKENHSPDDGTYGRNDIRAALEKLFHSKCVYCETKPGAGSSWDVEHFRPKGRVAERADHTGYYWLTYDWANLYLSCQLCNQSRKDKPTFDEPVQGDSEGKLDQFPLGQGRESTRAMIPSDNINNEDCLLLDPCDPNVNPEDFITFGVDGMPLAIDDNPKGKASIRVFNLGRKRLRDLRLERIAEISQIVLEILPFIPADQHETALDAIFEGLKKSDRLFSGLARAMRRDPDAFGILEA